MVVIGMTIAYFATYLGMLLAYLSYRKRRRNTQGNPPTKDNRP